jgi:hypothetical protein
MVPDNLLVRFIAQKKTVGARGLVIKDNQIRLF